MNTDVVNKTVYDKLVAKVNAIDVSGFVLKTQYDTDESGAEKEINVADNKIPDISGFNKKQIIMQKWVRLKAKYLIFLF